MVCRLFGVMAIAVVTTTTTISFTNYLLSRPWCIQLDANGEQNIVYGHHTCDSTPRLEASEKQSSQRPAIKASHRRWHPATESIDSLRSGLKTH